jgi:hypothetical protein
MIMARTNNNTDNLLIKCIFLVAQVLGLFGSFFLRNRYSAIWSSTRMVNRLGAKIKTNSPEHGTVHL